MRLRSFGAWVGVVGLVLSVLGALPASAAPVVKITVSGTISSGTDTDGQLTNSQGADLAGLSVTLIQTLEAGGSAFLDVGNDPSASFFDLVSMSISIDGGPVLQFGPPVGGATYVIDPGTPVLDSQATIPLGGDTLFSWVSIVSGLIANASPLQEYLFAGPFDIASFVYADRVDQGSATLWNFQVNSGSLRSVLVEVVNDVPEPAVALLVAAALLASVVVRARRTGQQAVGH